LKNRNYGNASLAIATVVVVATLSFAQLALAQTQDPASVSLAQIESGMDQAKKNGAKGQLPTAWWKLDKRIDAAKEDGATEAEWGAIAVEVERLGNAAIFVAQMRKQKSGIEAVLGRFDQALAEVAALHGLSVDPLLSGKPAADDLISRLSPAIIARQIEADSLRIENRRFQAIYGTESAFQDSMITALQLEVSALHQNLWQTELRAGVAEADRSAAEIVLTNKQQREAAIAELRNSFKDDEADVRLTGDGSIVMRVYGLSFAVGSSNLQAGQSALLAKVTAAISSFPTSAVRVEGHTDDTGSRETNLRLSQERAATVARALEKELGWAGETIVTEGFGPDRPLALNSSAEGRARNRRIDVVITGG
jgi:outer membrane protein OmpA-like peptidoglycan-associated protein